MTEAGVKGRPVSATSSQISISDRMTDLGEEEDNSSLKSNLLQQVSSSCSSLQNVQKPTIARTTTISTIAMESNTAPAGTISMCSPTRLVIALLQTPHRSLQLKVIELNPPLLKLPDNFPDAEDFLKNHNQVIKNLQNKQSPVEELLRQADSLIATQKPRAEVYAAMADSLGQTWKDLNEILEERKTVILLAFNAHQKISTCLHKMDEVHTEYSRISYIGGEIEENAAGLLHKLKRDRAEILKGVAKCLESCDILLSKIAEYNYTIDSRELVLLQDVEFATRQVHRWLERLHDRRVILEERLRNKREQLEEFSDNSKYENEFRSLLNDLQHYFNFSQEFDFGDSVPSSEKKKEELNQVQNYLKSLQEKALGIAKRLEESEFQRAKFTPRSGLKNKIYEILGQTNDLLTESMDLDSSLSVAKEFFRLADIANDSLDSFSTKPDPIPLAKTDLNKPVYDALSKGKNILDSYGWDSPKTKGVRAVHDSLLKKKDALFEELEHLHVLDEYNHFLESVNQTYQNILNIETSTVRQQVTVPLNLESVHQFKSTQEKTLEDVSRKLALDTLMTKLQDIYPNLSEEEKYATESKINELKSLSNHIVELLVQRVEIAAHWLKILEIYKFSSGEINRNIVLHNFEQITRIYETDMKNLLEEIRKSDQDLEITKMETEIERIIKELQDKLDSYLANERIGEICHKYKVKLDHHLLGDPQYYPVLPRQGVTQALQNTSKVASLNLIIHEVIKPKLENTLANFFQPLLTSYRQEVLDAKQSSLGKSQEESDFERYCDRLKESYVTVTKKIELYLSSVLQVCQQVETRLVSDISRILDPSLTVQDLQNELNQFDTFREQISDTIAKGISPNFDHLLQTISREEPPREGEEEVESLRRLMAHLGHDEELDTHRAMITRQVTDSIFRSDLDVISRQLQHLIDELATPANYGDNLLDAQANLDNFKRFETTTQMLRERLTSMLESTTVPSNDDKAQLVRQQLQSLSEKQEIRRDLILLSLEYFKLVQESLNHYDEVNKELETIREKSTNPSIQVEEIESLLKELQQIKRKEAVQERRLDDIERISVKLFGDTYQQGQHQPLRQKNQAMTGELRRVESDLHELLDFLKSRSYGEIVQPPKEVPKTDEVSPEMLALEQSIILSILTPVEEQQQPSSTTTIVELKELQSLQTLSVMSNIPRSTPMPLSTVEKETQFELEEEKRVPEKVERDTVTQTMDERISTMETQTDHKQEQEMFLPVSRPVSKEYNEPMFIEPLKDIVVNEGDHVVLECRATGQVKKLVWLKDGLDVSNNPDYKSEFVDNSYARMSIDEVFLEDSAVFTCRAIGGVNNSVMVETSGKLTVREPIGTKMIPPAFVPHPPISTGVHEKPHYIQFKVNGYPLPTVQWFKNGICIDTSPDYIITFNNGVCNVQFDELLKELDEGIFSCLASNSMGEVETHIELQVKGDASKKSAKQKPKIFTQLPKYVMSCAGQPLKLQCSYESTTECNILWWKDESKILNFANSSAMMHTEGNIATLTFNELYPVDSGKYTVLIRNADGECQSECNVTVKGLLPPETSDSEPNMEVIKPIVKMQLKDNQVVAGNSIKLDCVIVAHPEPEVIWYKNSSPIKESSNHHLIFHGDRCALIIKSATKEDQGKYSVVALNNGGEVECACHLVVRDAKIGPGEADEKPPVNPPKFTTIVQDQMVTAGDELKFVVELEPQEGVEAEVNWYKNSLRVEGEKDIELIKEGNLYSLRFKECKPSDKGNYMAKATNSGGDAKCFACLIVKDNLALQQIAGGDIWEETAIEKPRLVPISRNATAKAPRFVMPLEGRMVDEGDSNVLIKCIIDASPPAQLKWTKNNSTDSLLPSVNISEHYNERSGDAELVLKKVGISDAGRYTCSAANEFGCATSVCDVVVKKTAFPPVFSKRLQSLMLEEGKRLYLEIDVYAKPASEIIWELNNERIYDSADFVMKSDTPTRHSLIIASVNSARHSGEYKVTARNDAGEAVSSCIVNVIKRTVLEMKIPPVVPQKPKVFPPTLQSSEIKTSEIGLVPKPDSSIVTSSSIRKEISSFETQTKTSTIMRPNFAPFEYMPKSPSVLYSSDDEFQLEPGPKPEILRAATPTNWNNFKNQVKEKVKTFEETSEMPDIIAPPSGGVRIIPVKQEVTKVVTSSEEPKEKVVKIPIMPLLPFPFSVPDNTTSIYQEPPKQYFDSVSSSSYQEMNTNQGHVTMDQKQQSTTSAYSEVKLIKPSKFIPEKMRESDYESDFESIPIPTVWTPRAATLSPTFPTPIQPPTTTSAFASCKPGSSMTSTFSEQRLFYSEQKCIGNNRQKPSIPPKPRFTSPPPSSTFAPSPDRVRQLIKSWPPQEEESYDQLPPPTSPLDRLKALESSIQQTTTTTSQSRLSPRSPSENQARALSPTPSKEALEMDKMWSRPIRLSSPTKFTPSPISSPPPPMSPRYSDIRFIRSPTPPLIPPKPLFTPSPRAYTPITSPVPPKYQTYPISEQKSPNEPLYYVSVVSTPRSTPVPPFSPPPLSPTPDTGFSESNFQDKKEFFEQSSSSYSTMESKSTTTSSYHHSSSSSMTKNVTKKSAGDSALSLLDSSFLPAPGESPEFLFAPPPPLSRISPGGFETHFSSSSSNIEKQKNKQRIPHEIRIQPPTPPAAALSPQMEISSQITIPSATEQLPPHSAHSLSKAMVPYIKPSKFTPKLGYASSLEKSYISEISEREEPIRPKWNPDKQNVNMTSWKSVFYEPSYYKETSKPRRNSLTILVDQRMQDLNSKFKENINFMTQGLCYNKLDRKVAFNLEPSLDSATEAPTTTNSVEANPLIYFKYDFAYEFGIADPKSVIRAASEPPRDRNLRSLPEGYAIDESTGTIHLPIIHEKTNK